MRKSSGGWLVAAALLGLAACQEPGDPPNPEVRPGTAVGEVEPGMTTGQPIEEIDMPGELPGTDLTDDPSPLPSPDTTVTPR